MREGENVAVGSAAAGAFLKLPWGRMHGTEVTTQK